MFKYILCDSKTNNSYISRSVLATYRLGNWTQQINVPIIKQILWIFYKICNLFIVNIVANADIPAECNIGENLYLAHGANGVVIHPKAIIGRNVKIYHQVTIGSKGTGNDKAPIIGDNVFIGVGAKVLGSITVGNKVKIGANAIVINSIPDNFVARGSKAIIYKQ